MSLARRLVRIATLGALTVAAVGVAYTPASGAVTPCGAGSNPITCENSKQGSPREDWYAPNAYGAIKGFTTKESVQPGETLQIKVQSPVSYRVQIYRLGWYDGDGARKMPTSPTAIFPAKTQPNCISDVATGLVDCGNWATTASWTVPSDAVSGLYLAILDQTDNDGYMPYPFVVRNESSHSDIVVQTSDQTWQAYNDYGGRNLYDGNGPAPDGRAYKVSYNRPLDVGGDNGIYGSEYAMLSWLERNGYDVSYLSGIDVATKGSLLLNHKIYMSSGHDEYWTQSQWDNVKAARDAGVNLAFFSGNDVFWRTRLEASADGANTANRTLVCYKMTKMALGNGIADPSGTWTGTYMDPVGAGTGGGQPQNQLTGTLFRANGYRNDAITISEFYGKMRMWRNTSVASLPTGGTATFQNGTLGYEWNVDEDNGYRPSGMIDLSSTTVNITDNTLLLDNGNTYGNGTATHSMTMYRAASNALVFSSGTVQWSWGLDATHVGSATTQDQRIQQATVNILADLGAQPQTRQSNLFAASASTDIAGPTTTVNTPADNATVPAQSPVTISGTTAEVGGGRVARVEVSVDGGTTWKAATGIASWTFSWTPTTLGPATVKVRSIDDSVNIGGVVTRNLTVGQPQCPCSIFPNSVVPGTPDAGDYSAVQLGVKFRTTQAGSITGVRFYQSALNTGSHVGYLWSSSGQLMGTTTANSSTGTGWRTLTFPSPIPVKANTTYTASYYTPTGHYSADGQYFATKGAGLQPMQALQSGVDGLNGVYQYGSSVVAPTNSWNNTNYYVDAVLDTSQASTAPPTVTATNPTSGATNVAVNSTVQATFNNPMDQPTLVFTLRNAANEQMNGSVAYNASTKVATFTPGGQLAPGTTYTASIQGTDLWGNAMSAPYTWTFTTNSAPPSVVCPCSVWPDNPTPQIVNPGDPTPIEVGMRFTSAVDGQVTGVRYYQGPANTGEHFGRLWSNSGQLLATGTFATDNTPGWKTLTFATPVNITANTIYIVSYYAPVGQYAVNPAYFTAARSNYPLTAVASTGGQTNGLYRYGTQVLNSTNPPNSSYNASNYWVDVVFTTSGGGGGGTGTQTVALNRTTATNAGTVLAMAGLLAMLPTAAVAGWARGRNRRWNRPGRHRA